MRSMCWPTSALRRGRSHRRPEHLGWRWRWYGRHDRSRCARCDKQRPPARNGGGGGEGSGDGAFGSDGLDPMTINPAAGGTGLSEGGDGGNGSAGIAAGAGATGQNGAIVTRMGVQHVGGGGGGGGGAG